MKVASATFAELTHFLPLAGNKIRSYDIGMNLAEALDTNASRRPCQPAVITRDRVITHSEFRDMVCRRAAHLANLGVVRSDIVGVNLKDTPENLAALFALARIGAAALPMD